VSAAALQVIAAIFEFLGAMLLGGQVTRTIAGGIAKTTTFTRFPSLFAFGERQDVTQPLRLSLGVLHMLLAVHGPVSPLVALGLVFVGGALCPIT
jgi:sodium-dependent phosphate transporter